MTTTDEHLIIPTQTRISFLDGPVGQGAHAEYSMRVAAPGLDPGPVPPGPRTSDDPVAAGYQRFTLDPESVVGVYPPPDSAADFTHVLPHIELTPATLPWEHSVGSAHSAGTPWLALLLITDDELVATRTGTVEQVLSLTDHNVLGPRIDLAGIPPTLRTSRCTTVDVPLDIAAAVLPRPAEALHLAFTRRVSTAGRKLSNYAVVVTNRLARRDARYAAHLVSLEGHGDSYLSTGDQGTANAVVRFVSLWSWSFTSQPADRRTTPATLASPRHAASACAPLAAGWMPVPAKSPNGEEVVCWYRGPFTGSSDAVGHDGDGGVDLSYAAAFELGRLLAMGHGRFDQLPDRVRARYRSPAALIEQLVADGSLDAARRQRHTPLTDRPSRAGKEVPSISLTTLLAAVPFTYLVPDARMLPPESIRLFDLDPHWVDALRKGAVSTGIGIAGGEIDAAVDGAQAGEKGSQLVSGMLVRSQLMGIWPGVVVSPHTGNSTTASMFVHKPSSDVLVILFAGTPDTVTLGEPARALRFGLTDDAETTVIRLRRLTKDNCDHLDQSFPVADQHIGSNVLRATRNRGKDILDVGALAKSLTELLRSADALDQPSITPAGLAMQLMSTPEQITVPAFKSLNGQ